jgi:hypothetical protein
MYADRIARSADYKEVCHTSIYYEMVGVDEGGRGSRMHAWNLGRFSVGLCDTLGKKKGQNIP